MMGLRFDRPDGGPTAARAVYEAGVLCAWANNDPSVLQFLPPLVLTDAQVEDLVSRVHRAFG
jgi:acetylornithine aminotransferase/putrescine aminotransferase